MNIIDIQDDLKNLPEQALMQEMQQPTGSAPQFLVLGELKRRKQMRDDYNRQQNSDMKTVAEEVVTAAGAPQEGIMQMARSLNPNTNMAQDTGLAQAAPVTPTQAPQPQAPQMMSGGGILRMARGGRFGTDILYNYKTFLQENNLNDTPYAQDMFARLKETMDNKYATEGPNNNPRIYDNAIGFERSPEGLGSVSSDVSDFMPNSGEFTRPESSLSPQILNELSVEPDAEFIRQTSPAEPMSILDQLRSSVYSNNPLENALAGTGLDSNVIGTSVIDPIMNRIDEAVSREGMPSQTAADIANEMALRNREMASENAGRLTVEELLAPAPEAYDATDKRPRAQGIASFGMFDPLVDRINEIRSEDAARNAAAEAGDLSAFLGVGSEAVDRDRELDPTPSSTSGGADKPESVIAADTSIDYSNLPIATLNRLADEGDDSAINQLRLNEISGLQTQSDISTGRDDLYMDSIMRGTLGQGRSDAAYAASLYNPSDISNAQDTITSLEEYLRLNPGNPQAEAQLAQAKDQLIEAQTSKETSIALQDIAPSTTPRRSEFQVFDATVADVEAVDAEDATDGGPNLVIQDEVIPTSESEKRRETAEDGGGITSLNPVVSDDKDSGGSSTSSGGAYGSIESRIAKMLSDRESSAEADKWMALAQTGMALMASKSPTFGGALGEAGLAGVGALQKSRKAYDSDIMSLLGMQQKIQSAKSLDASRAANSTTGGSKALNTMIDNAQAELNSLMTDARSYRSVVRGDPGLGTVDRVIEQIPEKLVGDIDTARERLATLQRISIGGGGAQFDATQ